MDGGGTKTACIVGDREGNILVENRGPSSNMKSRPWEDVKRDLIATIQDALHQSGLDKENIGGIFLGLAGGDRMEDRKRITDWLWQELPHVARITSHNDAVTALMAGTFGQKGIALISGTGSIAYGYDPLTGDYVRVGGWGYLLGDEGSGFDLGRKALIAVMRAYDGRGEPTALTELMLTHWSLHHPEQLINTVYGQENVRTAIADVSKIVAAAAEQGDRAAVDIMEEAIGSLEENLKVAAIRMGILWPKEASEGWNYSETPIPLILTGGVLSNQMVQQRFLQTAIIRSGAFEVRSLEYPPAVGAYLLALQEQGIALTESMNQRIKAFYTIR